MKKKLLLKLNVYMKTLTEIMKDTHSVVSVNIFQLFFVF